MFIREKHIKGHTYAYLVENTWKTTTCAQHVKAYLGKIITPTKTHERPLTLNSEQPFTTLIHTITAWELHNHGITEHALYHFTTAKLTINLTTNTFTHNNKPCTIKLNNGYLCTHTYQELLRILPSDNPEETGKRLATKLIQAGINLPPDRFITLYEALTNTR